MLNEMAHQNASKFAIFEMYKNTKVFFTFIALGEKVKYHEMKKQPWDMENFEIQISLLYSFDSFGKLQKIFSADTETDTEMDFPFRQNQNFGRKTKTVSVVH